MLAFAFVVLAFALIYYYAPDVKERHWYWITPGSVVGVLLWALSSLALRGYLHFFNSYSKTYGSLGAVIILMLWFYITGLAFLVGGEINSTAILRLKQKAKRRPSVSSAVDLKSPNGTSWHSLSRGNHGARDRKIPALRMRRQNYRRRRLSSLVGVLIARTKEPNTCCKKKTHNHDLGGE
jgi:hypothetical protein